MQRNHFNRASFDNTVRIWDVPSGHCVNQLSSHSDPVYSISLNPQNSILASGSFDKSVMIWDAKDGSLLRTFHGKAGVFETSFNTTGDIVAVCCADKSVYFVN